MEAAIEVAGLRKRFGATWSRVGTAVLAGLPATVQAGPFVTSPAWVRAETSGLTVATAVFDHVRFPGTAPGAGWRGASIGATAQVASSLPPQGEATGRAISGRNVGFPPMRALSRRA